MVSVFIYVCAYFIFTILDPWSELSFHVDISHVLFFSLLSIKQTIMRDKWMNIGYEDDELTPYLEPTANYNDPLRIGNGSLHYFTCPER